MSTCSISGLSLRLFVTGIPKHCINPLSELIWQWKTCSGEEWTVNRLKAIKVALIHQRSEIPLSIPLARNRKGGIKGVIGYLFKWATKNDSNFSKVVNAFMAYTYWTSDLLVKSQRKKFLEATAAQPKALPWLFSRSFRRTIEGVIQKRTIVRTPTPLVLYRGSPSKKAPTKYGSQRQSEKLLLELKLLDNQQTCDHVLRLWEPIYKWVFKGLDVKRLIDETHEDCINHEPMVGGEVHFLQEPGYKLRSIASPFRLFQVASEPLKDDLKDLIQRLPWDCTHDQGRAFLPVQQQIKAKKVVHSVDLSSATDLFPYDLQEIVLETIYGKECPHIRLFREVSKSVWNSDIGAIRWTKGQPLGFNPSFFLFTLTHGLLLFHLNGGKYNNEFFVVGDDVVILDTELYTKYISFLNYMECPYSASKSINSAELAEFAGKLILSDLVIPQLKWRQVSDDSFIDLARLIGPRIRLLLSSKQCKVLDVFSHVSNLVHPYGLNWSYEGSNLHQMILNGLKLTLDESVLASLTGLSGRVNNQLYADYGPYSQDLIDIVLTEELHHEIKTFDVKVLSVFSRLGFARKNYEYFLEGLKDIPETHAKVFNIPSMLPPEEVPPSRVTLLQRLSKFLRIPKTRN